MDMSVRATKSRLSLCATCFAALVLAGCGGSGGAQGSAPGKGSAFFAASNYEKARVEFRNALQIAPNDSEPGTRMDSSMRNWAIRARLAQFYQGAIDVNADNVPARIALGRLYLFSGAPEKALDTIKASLVKNPEDAGLLTVRAAARVQLKDSDAALQMRSMPCNWRRPTKDAVAVLAGIYKSREEPEKARVLLKTPSSAFRIPVDLPPGLGTGLLRVSARSRRSRNC